MIVNEARYVSSIPGHNSHILAVIDNVEMAVPIDENNRHYQAILKWVAENNKIGAAYE